ncbi:dolichol-phosphate mannosyltransferase [Solemya pervernicosa gill symbiont]|uniref:Dolichol-phosphate mannosyltransferase n=2 Tax=Gammaproteobacteria incertae sedis TaxID=118884 RepID=A0A1T2L2Y3_9GAMM|nr:glycosyltransferase family 2 protein [Candidatus Reidiella endopervernicosa]OOZ39478.1 dolichol-phosphate mannosyltransferase [Solemya pervernicosa gill symbiont]QKQ25899.1 glycosyltransferase family 2 protein [Candidatus Reidiella endopervernicosa]
MDLSVVVPVRNEADNIRPLIEEIRDALQGKIEYEIIYIDDGSDDETPQRLQQMMAELPQLRVLRHVVNCGQSTSVRSGVRVAQADWIATLDGDGQNDPADIPAMFAVIQGDNAPANLQMVAGWRHKRQDNWLRKLSSRVANKVRSSMLRDSTPDSGCGLKVFSRQAFLELPYFNHMHRFLPALIIRNGGVIDTVKVNHRPRTMGTSKYGLHNRLWVGLVDLFGVRWLLKRAKLPEVVEQPRESGGQ